MSNVETTSEILHVEYDTLVALVMFTKVSPKCVPSFTCKTVNKYIYISELRREKREKDKKRRGLSCRAHAPLVGEQEKSVYVCVIKRLSTSRELNARARARQRQAHKQRHALSSHNCAPSLSLPLSISRIRTVDISKNIQPRGCIELQTRLETDNTHLMLNYMPEAFTSTIYLVFH